MFAHAVILAAGRGERMKPITDYIPKALYRANGFPLIETAIDSLPDISLSVTYSYLGQMIVNQYYDYREKISFIHTDGNDNAWFLHNSAIKYINQPIIVIPCDIHFIIDWERLYNEFTSRNSKYMLVPVKSNYEGDSIYSSQGKITQLNRHKTGYIASGIQVFIPSEVPELNNFTNIWNYFIHMSRLDVSNTPVNEWVARDYV